LRCGRTTEAAVVAAKTAGLSSGTIGAQLGVTLQGAIRVSIYLERVEPEL